MTLLDDATGITSTQFPDYMLINTPIAALDSHCASSVSTALISNCPSESFRDDWAVYNFTVAGCDALNNYTFLSGNTLVLTDGCPNGPKPLYPATVSGSVACPPTPAPTVKDCEDSCCLSGVLRRSAQIPISPDTVCCNAWFAGLVPDAASCEAYVEPGYEFIGEHLCAWTCPTPPPTPAPPTPQPTKEDPCDTACCTGADPNDTANMDQCCGIWITSGATGVGNTPASCEAYGGANCQWTCPPTPAPTASPTPPPTHSPTPSPTPSPTFGLAPTPKIPGPVSTPNPTPSPTYGKAPTPKFKGFKVGGSFQVTVPHEEVDGFVNDLSVKAALERSIAAEAGVEETLVEVTLSEVRGGGHTDRAWGGGLKMRSAHNIEIQVGYEITVEGQAEASSVEELLSTMSAEAFASAFSAQFSGSGASYAVEAVAASATAPTVNAQASAVGDPHLVNVHGQRFDLMQPGNHTMILIPKGAHPSRALLGVVARAERIGKGCSDMYIEVLTITGAWVADVPGARRESTSRGLQYFAQKPPQRGSSSAGWNTYGNIRMKVVWGHAASGVKYLNLLVRNLAHAGYTVGGLLGEEDHTEASTPTEGCSHFMSLLGPKA